MSDTSGFASRPVQSYVFAAILVVLFLLVCRILAPFFTALLWSTLLYILASPLHQRVIRRIDFSTRRGRIQKNIWAAVFTLGTVVIILIPLSFMVTVFFRQIVELLRYSRDSFNRQPEFLRNLFESVSVILRDISAGQVIVSAGDIQRQVLAFVSSGLQRLVLLSGGAAKSTGIFFLNMFFIVFSIFFFYADGPYLSRLALRAIPIKKEYISALTGKFRDITRNLFFGYIIVALIQTVLAYIIFSAFQVTGALVFAALTFICVFIPMFGAGVVWLPLGIARIAGGDVSGGIVFCVVSALFISTLDNFIRPLFLRDRIQLHPLIIFFAILGGLRLFGFNGLILGPVAVIFFLTVLDMFLLEHRLGEEERAS